MSKALQPRLGDHGVGVWALRHTVLGWNDEVHPSPVPEARWALEAIRSRAGEVPTILVGHSMGGRTAVRVSDDASVVGCIGLTPWLPDVEDPSPLSGKHVRVAHARFDHSCGLGTMKTFLNSAREVAASLKVRQISDLHYLLRTSVWHQYVVDETLGLIGEAS